MAEAKIRDAQAGDETAIAEMMASLWPDGSVEEFRKEAAALVETGMHGTMAGAILLALDEGENTVGFLQVGLRSHADGCDTSRPVGFVEAWFVRPHARGQGIGRALMRGAEAWSQAEGCSEIASDALVDNAESLRAHEATGFEVVDRCVHFRKKL
jgi:aminoglycoside 6'-N-acetyltransferase I